MTAETGSATMLFHLKSVDLKNEKSRYAFGHILMCRATCMRKISCIRPLYLCSPIDSSDVLVHRVAWIEPFSRKSLGIILTLSAFRLSRPSTPTSRLQPETHQLMVSTGLTVYVKRFSLTDELTLLSTSVISHI